MIPLMRECRLLSELQRLVDAETDKGRDQEISALSFASLFEYAMRDHQMERLMTEIGKLAEAGSEIELAEASADDVAADKWRREFVRHAILSISIIQRSVLSLHDWPALHSELTWACKGAGRGDDHL